MSPIRLSVASPLPRTKPPLVYEGRRLKSSRQAGHYMRTNLQRHDQPQSVFNLLEQIGVKTPTRSVRKLLSTVMTWETLDTESLGRPVILRGKKTLPGACASFVFDVMTTTMTVAIRLAVKSLD
jgi:hypothetical protein